MKLPSTWKGPCHSTGCRAIHLELRHGPGRKCTKLPIAWTINGRPHMNSTDLETLWLVWSHQICEKGFNEPSFVTQQRKVPARFQECSGFSGRAFSCDPWPQTLKPNRFAVGNLFWFHSSLQPLNKILGVPADIQPRSLFGHIPCFEHLVAIFGTQNKCHSLQHWSNFFVRNKHAENTTCTYLPLVHFYLWPWATSYYARALRET